MIEPSGILLINKPIGCTSFQVIRILRRNTGVKKMGHGGTLDKNATGLLVIGVGKGTKMLESLLQTDKTYLFRMQFGVSSETGDALGTKWSFKTVNPQKVNEKTIRKVIEEKFSGEIWQAPPIYSALKKEGKRMSDYARNNEEVLIEPRKITIHSCTLLHFESSYQPQAIFRLSCSHGTYIRSFCMDLGETLESCAVMTNLCRTRIGSYHIGNSYTLEQESSFNSLATSLIPLDHSKEQEPYENH